MPTEPHKRTRIRLHFGRTTITLMRHPRVRFGVHPQRGYGHMGLPGLGVVTYLRRTKHTGASKFGIERVRR
jgi:hypothetical protein